MDNIYDTNDTYDIPIFKSLPALINFKNNYKGYIEKTNNISIKDIYTDEPFNNNINNKKYLLLFIILIFLIIYIVIFRKIFF